MKNSRSCARFSFKKIKHLYFSFNKKNTSYRVCNLWNTSLLNS